MSFYEKLADYYDSVFPFDKSRVEFLTGLLTDKGSYCLDIGCATGELVFALEKEGLITFGIDNSKNLIDVALKKKRSNGSKAKFIRSKMQDISDVFPDKKFDIVTCLGNTLVHLNEINELIKLFKDVIGILNMGSIFVGQLLNYEKILNEKSKYFSDINNNSFMFKRKYYFLTEYKKIKFEMELKITDPFEEYRESVELLPVTCKMISYAAEVAGFTDNLFYGGFDKQIYTPDANDLLFILKK